MTEAEALTAAVSGLDAVIYAYGAAGPHVEPGLRDRALAGLRLARTSRDLLASRIVAAGGTVPPAAAAYDVEPAIEDSTTAAAAIATVETRMAGVWADVASVSVDDARKAAIAAALSCGTRAAAWGGAPVAFPGR